jgi:Fibronectin type III domain
LPPAAPTALKDTNETFSSFTANWTSVSGATSYRLDVSLTNTFVTYVTGYQDRNVGNVTSFPVTGLAANTFYYYRVRAFNGNTSPSSNVIKAKTKPH